MTNSIRRLTHIAADRVDEDRARRQHTNAINQILELIDNPESGLGSHAARRELVHLADDDGPWEGFESGAYFEVYPQGDPAPTRFTWWTSSARTKKITEQEIVYTSGGDISTYTRRVYKADGVTVAARFVDAYSYSGAFLDSITRTRG